MKLSGLWCAPSAFVPQLTVKDPCAPFFFRAALTLLPAGTLLMSMKNDGSAGSALASPVRPVVTATASAPTAIVRPIAPIAILVRRATRCLPVTGDREFRAID